MIWTPIDDYLVAEARSARGLIVWVGGDPLLGSRPSYVSAVGRRGGWCAGDELHGWLEARVDTYELEWSHNRRGWWSIGVRDPGIAMLLKLSWI